MRDSESVAVELTASDKQGLFTGTLFLGSVKYSALKQVYDGRVRIEFSQIWMTTCVVILHKFSLKAFDWTVKNV